MDWSLNSTVGFSEISLPLWVLFFRSAQSGVVQARETRDILRYLRPCLLDRKYGLMGGYIMYFRFQMSQFVLIVAARTMTESRGQGQKPSSKTARWQCHDGECSGMFSSPCDQLLSYLSGVSMSGIKCSPTTQKKVFWHMNPLLITVQYD